MVFIHVLSLLANYDAVFPVLQSCGVCQPGWAARVGQLALTVVSWLAFQHCAGEQVCHDEHRCVV
jgi:hypothetical protein